MAVEPRVVPTVIIVPTAHPTTISKVVVEVVVAVFRHPQRIHKHRVGIDARAFVELDDVVADRVGANHLITAAELSATVVLVDVAGRTGVVSRPFRCISD